MTSPLGLTPFRTALALEIFGNIASLPMLFLAPEKALSFLVQGPAQITPATRSLVQVFGGIVAAFTVPLVLSWSNPQPGPAGHAAIAFRRAAYITLGAGEVCLAAVSLAQYVMGDSGLADTALLGTAATMVAFIGMRATFLVVKPEWLEGREGARKKTL